MATYFGLSQRRFPPERRLVKIALIVPDLSEVVLPLPEHLRDLVDQFTFNRVSRRLQELSLVSASQCLRGVSSYNPWSRI